jgi:hypothetical protein
MKKIVQQDDQIDSNLTQHQYQVKVLRTMLGMTENEDCELRRKMSFVWGKRWHQSPTNSNEKVCS